MNLTGPAWVRVRLPVLRAAAGAAALSIAHSPARGFSEHQERPNAASAGAQSLQVAVFVHWEGRDLEPHNLAALSALRGAFPDLRLTHLLSPAYFLKPGADADKVKTRIRSVVRDGDSIAVSLAGWKSLVKRAGVIFRDGPTFWGARLRPSECAQDCGQDVPLSVYPPEDGMRLVRTSLDVLEEHGFGRAKGLAVLGWTATPRLLEAAARVGIRFDFSSVAPELVAKQASAYPLYQWVKGLWGQITPHAQPFKVVTPAGTLTEAPQALASLDYVSLEDVMAVADEYMGRLRQGHSQDLTLPLVVEQETAQLTTPILRQALPAIWQHAKKRGVPVSFAINDELRLLDASASKPATTAAEEPSADPTSAPKLPRDPREPHPRSPHVH